MNILFLTDSLGYPREDIGAAKAVNIWPYKAAVMLRKNSHSNILNFFFDARPGRDTQELAKNRDKHFMAYEPDIIVLQVGIVDCYSRSLTKLEAMVLPRIPFIGKVTKFIVKKYYKKIVKLRNIAYVNEKDFRANLEYMRDGFKRAKWVVIPIGPATSRYKERNPLIEQRVKKYNDILKNVFGKEFFGSCYDGASVDELYLPDNHHLSAIGHEIVTKKVYSLLEKMFDCESNSSHRGSLDSE